jgi:hypothetical protein
MNNKDFHQQIKMNNFYDKSNSNMNELIWDSIETADETLIRSLNSKLFDTYHGKINLLFNLLYSNEPLPIKDKKSVVKFFNIIAPLNNEFNMGSYSWNFKSCEKRLYVQNSVSKIDFNDYLQVKYLNPVKCVLNLSNIKFDYFQMKSNRYYKNMDIVFVFDFE